MKRVLITGGAGFIGSHLAEELLAHASRVRVLDSPAREVHGEERARPEHLAEGVDLVRGHVGDPAAVQVALKAVDAVFHLATRKGAGPVIDAHGTSVLLDARELPQ